MAVVHELWVDGQPASQADLTYHALFNYGAFTSFGVEGGGVRGLDLHLARLEASALELFGEAVEEGRLRALIRSALSGRTDAWLRVSLFSPEVWTREPHWIGVPKVMIGVFTPPAPLAGGVRLQPQVHGREPAHLKHAATFGLLRARRLARQAGFDDALFTDPAGMISEGSLWNIGFWRGDEVIWPRASMLEGVAQALIRQGLDQRGVRQHRRPVTVDDLPGLDGAFLCNSATPAAAIASIGAHQFGDAGEFPRQIEAAWRSNPCQTI